MSEATYAPARHRLPTIAAERAALQTAIVEALNQRRVGRLLLTARIAVAREAPAWIAFAGGLQVAPLLADRIVPSLTDAAGRADAAAAAVALGIVEPVIAAVEIVVGVPLRPVSVEMQLPDDGLIVDVAAHANRDCVHRLLLAVPDDARIVPIAELPLDPVACADVAPCWIARIAGPTVRAERLSRIAQGDLLLLGIAGANVRFVPPGRQVMLSGRLDLSGGSIMFEQEHEPAPDPQGGGGGGGGAADDLSGISVATSVEIDGGGLTMERLAALGPGSVVAVPGAAGGVLAVRLMAGGKAIASGELVAVGDGYGVLITGVAQAATPGPASADAPAADREG